MKEKRVKENFNSQYNKTQDSIVAAAVGGIGGGLILSSKVMTGAVVADSLKPTTYFGITLLILGIIAGFMFIRAEIKNNKNKRNTSRKKRK